MQDLHLILIFCHFFAVEEGCYPEKFQKFLTWAEPEPKIAFFHVFRVPFWSPAKRPVGNGFSKNVESLDSGYVPFASLETPRPRILEILTPQVCHHENLKFAYRQK